MIKAVIFDMYETLITLTENKPYFGREIAFDAGIDEALFAEPWRRTENDRTLGKVTFEKAIENILREFNCYSEEKINNIIKKRIRCKEESFEHLHPGIILTLEELRKKGILIGLISNCFSEEAEVIRKSVLFPYFNAVCLSSEEGLKKPDPAIFHLCLKRLNLNACECLYAGDGGSNELCAAEGVGMKAVQAVWYFKENKNIFSQMKADFEHVKTPTDILNFLN